MTPRGAEWRGWCSELSARAGRGYVSNVSVIRSDVPVVVTPEPLAAARARVVEAALSWDTAHTERTNDPAREDRESSDEVRALIKIHDAITAYRAALAALAREDE